MQIQSEGAGQANTKALTREARLVPIVIPISNPTIGVGLGGGLLYMHEKPADANEAAGAGFRYMPVEDQKLSAGIDLA